jgi:outer membrane protein assembly factor BamB
MNFFRITVLSISLTLVLSALLTAGDWPEFRGPGRDGLSTEKGLLKKWPKDGPKLIWSQGGLGLGHATVVIQGDRMYTTGDQDDGNYLHALKRDGGDRIWKRQIGKAGGPGWGDFKGTRSTPAVDGDRVYALGQYGELICCESKSGEELWRKHFIDDFGASLPEWGFSEGLLVDGKRLVCSPGGDKGTVIALDKLSGETLWRCKDLTDQAQYASLIRVEIAGVPQYVVFTQANVAGIGVGDGKLLWRAKRDGKIAICTTPVYKDGHVYVTSEYDIGCNLYEIKKQGDKFVASEKYDEKSRKVMLNKHGGVVLVGNHVYGHSGPKGWVCQDLMTGELKWRAKRELGVGTVTYADGKLFLRQEDGAGTVVMIKASPKGFEELGRFDPPHRSKTQVWSAPVILDGRMYVRDNDWLLCYDVRG